MSIIQNDIGFKEKVISKYKLFTNGLNGSSILSVNRIREDAFQKFLKLRVPTIKDEEWKYTNISPLFGNNYELTANPVKHSQTDLSEFVIKYGNINLIVFVNGCFSKELSVIKSSPQKVFIESFSKGLHQRPELINKYLAKYAKHDADIFTALNAAFLNEGVIIHVPDNTVVEEPIHVLYLSDSSENAFLGNIRNLIVAGKGSQLTFIEAYHHLSHQTYFNNVVTELVLNESANLHHIRIQNESSSAYNINTTHAIVDKNSVYSSYIFDLGGFIVRNNLNVTFSDMHGESNLYGLYLPDKSQLIDNHTCIDHAFAHCNSNELYKGIVDAKARGVFNGKIYVRPNAQKTNAFQKNKNILLSDEAIINTKPQLEIFADDVKCSHGATIGQLDEEALFYLRSRGIGYEDAKSILRIAFFEDVIEKIPLDYVREFLHKLILKRFQKK